VLTSRHLLWGEDSLSEPAQGERNERITLNFFDLARPIFSKSYTRLS